MAGLGTAPLGVAPYGLGTPALAAGTNGGSVLADVHGVSQGSRYINPRTRQYEFDSFGRLVGMPNVQQLVTLAVLTIKGSSAVADLGIAAPSGVIGTNFVARRTTEVRDALASLVREGLIEIVSIEVRADMRPVFTLVRWRDLTTQDDLEITLG